MTPVVRMASGALLNCTTISEAGRISAVNAALTAHAAAAGLAVLDFVSISMAAGCGHSSDGLHYSKAVYRAQADALFSLLARARR